jgi:Tfp pilus assembly PilM family ATPase
VGRSLSFAINDDSVEMAAVYKAAWIINLLGIRKVYFPGDATSEEARRTFATATIEEFIREYGGRYPSISLSVSGPETSFRTFVMPRLKKRQLSSAITFEVNKRLPFPVDDCYYGFREIARTTRNDTHQVKMSLQAATRRIVEGNLAPCEQLGHDVVHVYNAPDAIGQLLPKLPNFDENASQALINVERNRSQIAFYRGANLEFNHYSSLGSVFLSQRGDRDQLASFAGLLSEEIQNSLEFYAGQFSTRFSNKVFVYGDLAYADDLAELLSTRFGFEFSRFPTEELSFLKGHKLGREMSLPVCLSALAASVCDAKIANLLPKERLAKIKRKTVDRMAPLLLTVLALAFLANWSVHRSQMATINSYLADLSQNIESFENSRVFVDYNLIKQQVAIDQSYLNKAQERPSHLGLNLKELSLLTPATIRLTYLDLQSKEVTGNLILSGVVTSENIPPEIILAEFIESLSNSAFYRDVIISRHNKKTIENDSGLYFTLKLTGVV